MEYSRNTITLSWRRYEMDVPAETQPKRSVQPVCIAVWTGVGLLVGGFWLAVFSVAWKLVA
jgi:hypothetical protein